MPILKTMLKIKKLDHLTDKSKDGKSRNRLICQAVHHAVSSPSFSSPYLAFLACFRSKLTSETVNFMEI
jgi:hypothetical protein